MARAMLRDEALRADVMGRGRVRVRDRDRVSVRDIGVGVVGLAEEEKIGCVRLGVNRVSGLGLTPCNSALSAATNLAFLKPPYDR